MAEVARSIPDLQLRDESPPLLPGTLYQNYPNLLEVLISEGPELIAALEYTFPGGTYAFLGRDAMNIADLVDAFYLSIGQEERVQILGLSGSSMNLSDGGQVLGFLESHGFSYQEVLTRPPYVLVDVIATGGRQPRSIISRVYEKFAADGHDPALLIRKLNIFGLDSSGNRYNSRLYQEKEQLFSAEEAAIRDSGVTRFDNLRSIIRYPNSARGFNTAGYGDYKVPAWHSSFGRPVERADGSLVAKPGFLAEATTRQGILWLQVELLRETAKPEFLDRVREAARGLDYEFPLGRAPLKCGGLLEEAS